MNETISNIQLCVASNFILFYICRQCRTLREWDPGSPAKWTVSSSSGTTLNPSSRTGSPSRNHASPTGRGASKAAMNSSLAATYRFVAHSIWQNHPRIILIIVVETRLKIRSCKATGFFLSFFNFDLFFISKFIMNTRKAICESSSSGFRCVSYFD